ncbi:MAG: fibrillarin-like rRNA/tRNA 2'-O-methyltransferase [archaeon YNP-WB-040]|nr:fibrillarin-like rRNA/tRNA 2'-O-methyltransferase [Candidatus Culexarchaeum yellowstonense]
MSLIKIYEDGKFKGVYWCEFEDGSKRLATVNMVPGVRVYGEQLVSHGGVEFRVWNAFRSKLAAAILKGVSEISVKPGSYVLYLGTSTGTTISHVSDIIGPDGCVFGVEVAPRPFREFMALCEKRRNIVPILSDARTPTAYRSIVPIVDGMYCDVAQPDQAKILIDNARLFLKPNGLAMLAIKARSIDVTLEPSEVYKREINCLVDGGFEIISVVHLEPYDKDHAMVVARYVGK